MSYGRLQREKPLISIYRRVIRTAPSDNRAQFILAAGLV
jgi:hypothetical protein